MIITFLGTGTSMGVPVVACPCEVCHSADSHDHRLRTSAVITTDDGKNFLMDIGPDFRMQMLSNGFSHIDAILVTHAHRDHVAGLDDVRPLNYMQNGAMQMYANATAISILRHDYRYIFEPHPYPGLPEVDLYEVDGSQPFVAAGHEIVPIRAMHKDMPVLGFRIGDIVYITDANHIEPDELVKASGCSLLVINALRKEHHFSHFCLSEALTVVEKIAPSVAYITHISHEMGFHANVEQELPSNVHLAYDGLKVTV